MTLASPSDHGAALRRLTLLGGAAVLLFAGGLPGLKPAVAS